jgi:hypothetical protein
MVWSTPVVVIRYSMFSRAPLVAWICAAYSGGALAESVTVKYRGEVPPDTFRCATIDRSSLVERVCYDAGQSSTWSSCSRAPTTNTARLARARWTRFSLPTPWAATSTPISGAADWTGRSIAGRIDYRGIEHESGIAFWGARYLWL